MNIATARVFCAVAEQQSFTRAAQRLGLDKSSVSRIIKEIEDEVGVELLARTTRNVRPTPEGIELLQRLRGPLLELETVFTSYTPNKTEAQGSVTLATTPDLAQTYLVPALAAFRMRHPKVALRFELSNKLADFVREGVDLAVRIGKPGGADFVAKKVGVIELGFYASPAYLERRGSPAHVGQLAAHETLWPAPPKGYSPEWTQASFECDDFTLLAHAARRGVGVAVLPNALARVDVASGLLVRVLGGIALGRAPIYVVSKALKKLPTRVLAVRSFLLGLEFGA
jgi:DNA-binding transcriptional LysR family regulator